MHNLVCRKTLLQLYFVHGKFIQQKSKKTKDALKEAGLLYNGERFETIFSDFIEKYKLTDMYTSGFYPFETEEERWAYWSRHIQLNRWNGEAGKVYQDLLSLSSDKEHFVLTTNADGLFVKAGFSPDKVFAVHGDYGKLQCARKCHNKLYDNRTIIEEMVAEQMTLQSENSFLIRMNKEYSEYSRENKDKTITFSEDISEVFEDLI